MKRRDFIKMSAGLGAAMATTTPLSLFTSISTTAAAYVMRSPWFMGKWCVPSPIPRPVTILPFESADAATRGVHFAASAAAFSTPSQRGW